MSFIQKMYAERIGGSSYGESDVLYKFEKIKIAKREASKAHPGEELIDLGVGQPDHMAEKTVIDELSRQALKWENRDYADNGIDRYKEAAAAYMENVFGVSGIDSRYEVLHMIGSKPALTMLPHAFINPGDIALQTIPGYPILGTITEWLGGFKYDVPLLEKNDFYPDLDAIPEEILKKAKLFYVNYPNNPTGQVATEEFYRKLVAFARKNEIIIVQDAAYAALRLDGKRPNSILSIDEAKDVVVEIHSMSKAFNMTGFRLGFVVGNRKIVAALATVKDNMDSGQFKPIQLAGALALSHPEYTEKMNRIYIRRQRKLCAVLNDIGFNASPSKGTFYLYVHCPRGTLEGAVFKTAEDFSQYLIKEKMISAVPWDDAGHYIRFSVTYAACDEKEEDRVMNEVRKRLDGVHFVF